jgi:hypothetical protein
VVAAETRAAAAQAAVAEAAQHARGAADGADGPRRRAPVDSREVNRVHLPAHVLRDAAVARGLRARLLHRTRVLLQHLDAHLAHVHRAALLAPLFPGRLFLLPLPLLLLPLLGPRRLLAPLALGALALLPSGSALLLSVPRRTLRAEVRGRVPRGGALLFRLGNHVAVVLPRVAAALRVAVGVALGVVAALVAPVLVALVLVLELDAAPRALATKLGVEVVLDRVVRAPGKELGDGRPSIAELLVRGDDRALLRHREGVAPERGVELVLPTQAAALARAVRDALRDERPVARAVRLHEKAQARVLLRGGRETRIVRGAKETTVMSL